MKIDDIAAAWVAREDRAPLSAAEAAQLRAWLQRDRRHFGAYARARAVFGHFDRTSALGPHYDPRQFAPATPRNPSRRRFFGMVGATVAACAVGMAVLNLPGRRYSTRLGEVLRLSLEDGSVLTLNSATDVLVMFGRGARQLQLRSGEVLLDVAADLARPFSVSAGDIRIVSAIGSFTVQRLAGAAVEVMVQAGSVELSVPGASPLQKVRVPTDAVALVRPAQHPEVSVLQPMEVSRRLAWRDGMISFDGDTLRQAAAQFVRYSDLRIVIDDPAVASRRVVGRYSANDPVGFARAVALSMNLRTERTAAGVRLELPTSR